MRTSISLYDKVRDANSNLPILPLRKATNSNIGDTAKEIMAAQRRMYSECAMDPAQGIKYYLGKNECRYQGGKISASGSKEAYACRRPSVN